MMKLKNITEVFYGRFYISEDTDRGYDMPYSTWEIIDGVDSIPEKYMERDFHIEACDSETVLVVLE